MNKEDYEKRKNNPKQDKESQEPKKEHSTSSFWFWAVVIGLGTVLGWKIVKDILLFIAVFFISAFSSLLTPMPWICLILGFVITLIIKKL